MALKPGLHGSTSFEVASKFLVACMRLYTSLCRSVGPSEITSLFQVFRAERRSDLSYCPCPTTILPLPTRTRLMLPCIRPCFLLFFNLYLFILYFYHISSLPNSSPSTSYTPIPLQDNYAPKISHQLT